VSSFQSFRTAAQAEHAEREEDDRRTGYRTGAGYTRKAIARASERRERWPVGRNSRA
jgi:hypothetical protein